MQCAESFDGSGGLPAHFQAKKVRFNDLFAAAQLVD